MTIDTAIRHHERNLYQRWTQYRHYQIWLSKKQKMSDAERKSELWTKFYEEEKSRLERELLQAVFGNNVAASSIKSETKVPSEMTLPNSSSQGVFLTTNTPPKVHDVDAMFESPDRSQINIKIEHHTQSGNQDNRSRITSILPNNIPGLKHSSSNPPNTSEVNPTSTIDKLHGIRNELVQKWATEYVASSTNMKSMPPIQRHQLLEGLMKMRGAGTFLKKFFILFFNSNFC